MKARSHLQGVVRRPSERHGVGRRANAILLLDDGWTCEEVARALYLDDDTVRGWHTRFTAAALKPWRLWLEGRPEPALTLAQEAELIEILSSKLLPSTAR